jgi:Cu(I)/Ag(I) efflux system membrane fusion protein
MKAGYVLSLMIVAAGGAAAGWFWGRQAPSAASSSAAESRKVLFYQSAMHPWIKSDRPGKCTICGMDLTPVFEGDKGLSAGAGLVTLSSNSLAILHVKSEPVARRPLGRTLRVAGVIDEDETRRRVLSAYVDGRVDELHVNYVGAEVKAGEPLARFYSPVLLTAEREYLTLRQSQMAQRTHGSADEGAALLGLAAARLRQLGLTDAQIEALPDLPVDRIHSELVAPLSGTVVARYVVPGQYVREGDRLFELVDLSMMWFQFDLYERDLPWVHPGQSVEIAAPSLPGQVLHGTVSFIDPSLSDSTRSARARVVLDNPRSASPNDPRWALYRQQYAEGRLAVDGAPALTVPRSAVLSPDGRPVVYVDLGGGAFEARRVRLGRLGDQHWEVLEGLAEQEQVVVAGNLMIDAQAQLDATLLSSGEEAAAPHAHGPADAASMKWEQPTAAQREKIVPLLDLVAALGHALAADDLEAFRKRWPAVAPALNALVSQWESDQALHHLAAEVSAKAASPAGADLVQARQQFLPLAQMAAAAVRSWRAAVPELNAYRVYECPMVDQAWDGAPRRAQWLQRGPPLRNPYFGAEMLECGKEIAP